MHHLTKIYNSYIFSDEEHQIFKVRGKQQMSMQDAIDFMTKDSSLNFS
jgi:hypothetical protein